MKKFQNVQSRVGTAEGSVRPGTGHSRRPQTGKSSVAFGKAVEKSSFAPQMEGESQFLDVTAEHEETYLDENDPHFIN